MTEAEEALCEVHLKELEALKAEQVQRIGFRDNMLYVTLVAVGAIAAYALEGGKEDALPGARRYAFLVVPWICTVLGWTYIMNDEKISAIGDYIKKPGGLADQIHKIVGGDRAALFRWETAHRTDDWRFFRKLFQLAVDLTTFVVAGFVAMVIFHHLSGDNAPGPEVRTLMYVEGALLTFLGAWIVKDSGVWRGHGATIASAASSAAEVARSSGEAEKSEAARAEAARTEAARAEARRARRRR